MASRYREVAEILRSRQSRRLQGGGRARDIVADPRPIRRKVRQRSALCDAGLEAQSLPSSAVQFRPCPPPFSGSPCANLRSCPIAGSPGSGNPAASSLCHCPIRLGPSLYRELSSRPRAPVPSQPSPAHIDSVPSPSFLVRIATLTLLSIAVSRLSSHAALYEVLIPLKTLATGPDQLPRQPYMPV
jgi:hypothetical protein